MSDEYRTADNREAFPDGILAEYERLRERYMCSDLEAEREKIRASFKPQHNSEPEFA